MVIEVRNTSAFESAMRALVLREQEPRGGAFAVQFNEGPPVTIRPVGTKFLRRIVVPVPSGTRTVHFHGLTDWWLLRRLWIGEGRPAEISWQPPSEASGTEQDATGLLAHADGERLRLGPMEEIDLSFRAEHDAGAGPRRRYLLRMTGYYEFQLAPHDQPHVLPPDHLTHD